MDGHQSGVRMPPLLYRLFSLKLLYASFGGLIVSLTGSFDKLLLVQDVLWYSEIIN